MSMTWSVLQRRRRTWSRPAPEIVIPVHDFGSWESRPPVHDLLESPVNDFALPPLSPPWLFRTETEIPRRIHEVFLSFRGEDTRASFISHLQHALQIAAVNVFKDDDSIERGNIISDSLLQAIEDSEISVVIFSTSYADSRWCLEELAKIMDWRRTKGQIVLPVFYNVDPSEVRHQTGEFGNAFQNLLNRIPQKEHNWLSVEEEEKEEPPLRQHLEQRWRSTLREAAGLAGFVVPNSR